MSILGISCFYHDAAIALIDDEKIIFAAHEERYSRIKHDSSFPILALNALRDYVPGATNGISHVRFYENPFLKFARILDETLDTWPFGFRQYSEAIPLWMSSRLSMMDEIRLNLRKLGIEAEVSNSQHHMSHAASAFFTSGFEEAAVLTIDAVGEYACSTIMHGVKNELHNICEQSYPDSVGMLYSTITSFLGFKVNEGEYKVMGLAPYGRPKYVDKIFDRLVRLNDDGSIILNQRYFGYRTGLKMYGDEIVSLFGVEPRRGESPLLQVHFDIAASIQFVLNTIVLRMAKYAKSVTGTDNLCMAGGVALNCVSNMVLLESKIFKQIYIQPAAGDAGGALGAALDYAYNSNTEPQKNGGRFKRYQMGTGALGNSYLDADSKVFLREAGANFMTFPEEALVEEVVEDLAAGRIVGIHAGRSEFGPRALGFRSILADPRPKDVKSTVNTRIKFREGFRPFAPLVLEEYVDEIFEPGANNEFMLFTQRALPGVADLYPGVIHTDGTARVQIIRAENKTLTSKILRKFHANTGCPMLINTSFNIRGEPMVETPMDAFRCFMGTNMERLVIGGLYLRKEDQNHNLAFPYHINQPLD